jgi:peroxiredoxin family protein
MTMLQEMNNTAVLELAHLDPQALLERIDALEARIEELEDAPAAGIEDRFTLVVFSGELDRAIAAFIIATGAASMGLEVTMFFTFWGINIVKKDASLKDKRLLEKGFTAMMPSNARSLPLSNMNYFGIGAKLIRKVMKDNDVASLEDLMQLAIELDVRMVACEMSQELLGISSDELLDNLDYGGVGTFMGDAARSKGTLFI